MPLVVNRQKITTRAQSIPEVIDDDQLRSLGSPERSIMSPKGTSRTTIAPCHDVATILWLIGQLRLAPAGQMLQPPETWPLSAVVFFRLVQKIYKKWPPLAADAPAHHSDDDDQD
jgi:hypothetical protein